MLGGCHPPIFNGRLKIFNHIFRYLVTFGTFEVGFDNEILLLILSFLTLGILWKRYLEVLLDSVMTLFLLLFWVFVFLQDVLLTRRP